MVMVFWKSALRRRTMTMTMTKIPSRKTWYTCGRGPLIYLFGSLKWNTPADVWVGWTFIGCEPLQKRFTLCIEGPFCSECSWEVFGWSLSPLQKLVGDFLKIFRREICREIWKEFCKILLDSQNKGSTISGKFRSIFRKKFRSSKKSFVQISLCRCATLRSLCY